jgi:hypothetical protein
VFSLLSIVSLIISFTLQGACAKSFTGVLRATHPCATAHISTQGPKGLTRGGGYKVLVESVYEEFSSVGRF